MCSADTNKFIYSVISQFAKLKLTSMKDKSTGCNGSLDKCT